MASKDVAMRCAGIACLLLIFGPVYIKAGPGDDAGEFASNSSGFSQNLQPALLPSAAGTNSSILFTPILPLANSTDRLESAGPAIYPTADARVPSSQIVVPAPVAPELPKIQLAQGSPATVTPQPGTFVVLPGIYDDSESTFTASSSGFNYPFLVGIPISFAVITGSRALPDGFQPQNAARFPGVGQAGAIVSSGIELGLGYSPGGFGTFGLNYRILSGLTKVYYITASGAVDPLVAQFVNLADSNSTNFQAGYIPPPTVTVSDTIGSCIVASHFTLNQIDLTYQTPILPVGGMIGLFGEVGTRAAVFFREDYTNSSAVFQQSKSTDAGFGPVGGLGISLFLRKVQLYVKADGGSLFSWAHQLDREMVIVNNAAQIQAAETNGFYSVPMLGVEVGALFYEGPYVTIGVRYRFDQWWGLDNLGGSSISWDSNGVQFDFRWRF
jgi:hypothetical protein